MEPLKLKVRKTKQTSKLFNVNVCVKQPANFELFERFSLCDKLIRVVAWCRFLNNSRKISLDRLKDYNLAAEEI